MCIFRETIFEFDFNLINILWQQKKKMKLLIHSINIKTPMRFTSSKGALPQREVVQPYINASVKKSRIGEQMT